MSEGPELQRQKVFHYFTHADVALPLQLPGLFAED